MVYIAKPTDNDDRRDMVTIYDFPAMNTQRPLLEVLRYTYPNKTYFTDRALSRVEELAYTRQHFTTDNVWEMLPKPEDARWIGPVMQKAARLGLIRRTDLTTSSDQGSNHSRPVRVWESLVYC